MVLIHRSNFTPLNRRVSVSKTKVDIHWRDCNEIFSGDQSLWYGIKIRHVTVCVFCHHQGPDVTNDTKYMHANLPETSPHWSRCIQQQSSGRDKWSPTLTWMLLSLDMTVIDAKQSPNLIWRSLTWNVKKSEHLNSWSLQLTGLHESFIFVEITGK
jgi:hypothetical protein